MITQRENKAIVVRPFQLSFVNKWLVWFPPCHHFGRHFLVCKTSVSMFKSQRSHWFLRWPVISGLGWVLVSLNLLSKNVLGSQRTLSLINVTCQCVKGWASKAVQKKTTFDVLLDLFHKSHIRSDDL